MEDQEVVSALLQVLVWVHSHPAQRERERDRERQTETERQTERQRERDRETEREVGEFLCGLYTQAPLKHH